MKVGDALSRFSCPEKQNEIIELYFLEHESSQEIEQGILYKRSIRSSQDE